MDQSLPGGVTTRRRFLLSAGLLGIGGVLAACSQATPAAPTSAPAAAAKPAATTAPAAAPTTAPAAAAKPAATTAPAAAPTTAPAAAAATTAPRPPPPRPRPPANGQLKDVPAQPTLLLAQGGTQGKYLDWDLWNAYALGANHQTGPNLTHEPLAFYSAYGNKEYLWLATSYEYTPDFKQLTIKLRDGIKWSDGEPFSADDVVYTLSTLKDLGSKVRWGVDVQQALDSVSATDPSYGRRQVQGAGAALLRPADLQVRHRRLHGAEAHLLGRRRLDQLQVLRPGQGLAGDHRTVEDRRRLARAEGLRAARRAGGRSRPA